MKMFIEHLESVGFKTIEKRSNYIKLDKDSERVYLMSNFEDWIFEYFFSGDRYIEENICDLDSPDDVLNNARHIVCKKLFSNLPKEIDLLKQMYNKYRGVRMEIQEFLNTHEDLHDDIYHFLHLLLIQTPSEKRLISDINDIHKEK